MFVRRRFTRKNNEHEKAHGHIHVYEGLEVINQNDVQKPKDIAAAVLHLASSDASFVQGTKLRVDGGRLA